MFDGNIMFWVNLILTVVGLAGGISFLVAWRKSKNYRFLFAAILSFFGSVAFAGLLYLELTL